MDIPEFIEIKNVDRQLTALLAPDVDGIKDCYLDVRLNAESTLTFFLPMISEKWEEIVPECLIIVGGREYTILHDEAIDIERDQQGKIWGKVMAQESWKKLGKQYLESGINNVPGETPTELGVTILSGGIPAGGYSAGSAGSALTYLLAGSGWTLDVCDVIGTHDLETEKESLLANIQKVQEIWGGYLVWDSLNHKVSLRAESIWQNYTGFQIMYRKNLKHITRTDNNNLVTRLYAFGQDGLDISSVNGGVKYLENFSYTSNVYVDTYENQEISDPQELKDKTTEELGKICKPRYTYRVGMVDLRTLPEYSHEDFSLGDMVDVIDQELGFDVKVRIIRHKYNLFQPWKCELEIGDFQERFVAKLADSFNVAKFVSDALKPNPATSNLLKGFINTFATTINSANGKLVWNDSTLEAIEIDEAGEETGKRVRVTPGGIGISTDGGQTFVTAMTGAGILANTVIVNALYALSTDDGFTKLEASGLHVYDEAAVERLIAGWWMDGETKRFGLNVKASDGATTLLDDRGILQTWQVTPGAENLDSTHNYNLNLRIPAITREIKECILQFKLAAFRAYETGAASGGGGATTSASGGGSTQTSDDEVWKISQPVVYDIMTIEGSHDHGGETGNDSSTASHNHGISNGTKLLKDGGGYVTYSTFGGDTHNHSISSDGNHAHGIDARHSHDIDIPSHSHTVNIPSHSHNLVFGIYEATTPQGVTIIINGVDRSAALGGPFNADQDNLDIKEFLVAGNNIIQLGSTRLGRIDASIFIQALMGV